jgi:hypothetical protein
LIFVDEKTLQRWNQEDNEQDGRLDAIHTPKNKLTKQERDRMIQIASAPEYADLPSNKIVPKLADKGIYIASESSFYRVNALISFLKFLTVTCFLLSDDMTEPVINCCFHSLI